MADYKITFTINGEEWKPCHLERLAYERNLHILHQMKQHGIEIRKDEGAALTDDAIDYLTADEAWEVSAAVRRRYSGEEMRAFYQDSFQSSDDLWKSLPFGQDKPMRSSHCHVSAEGITLTDYLKVMQKMQQDENVLLMAHPEHFKTIVTDSDIIGIEPFGMYGTPTLVHVNICDWTELGEQIRGDRLEDYPMVSTGRAYLLDGVTEINTPFHQMKPTENGFEGELAVYWPEGVPDEVVDGHSLHLAMEFYEALKAL